MRKVLSTVIVALCVGVSAKASVFVSVEAAGLQNTTIALDAKAVETFNGFTTGNKGNLSALFSGGTLKGNYGATYINSANQFGGAAGSGNFDLVRTSTALTIIGGGTDYFGLWASAIDSGSTVSFSKNGLNVGSVRLTDTTLSAAYKGNPTVPYLGRNNTQLYAFFNFVVPNGYDRVSLVQVGGGGFESDNHTIGTVSPVPEPAGWTLLIAGFGTVGVVRRRSRRNNHRISA